MPLKDGRYKGSHRATRRALLEMLKKRGEQTSAQLAGDLGISTMAVRQHLLEMEKAGDVASESRASGKGRPARHWVLTEVSNRHFPDRHRDLMLDLLGSVSATLGDEAMDRILDERCAQQVKAYGAALERCDTPEERVAALAELRSREGYMAEVIPEGEDELMLVENHCPICSAAKVCAGLCKRELVVFSQALGPECSVRRVEHVLEGDRRCAYRIRFDRA